MRDRQRRVAAALAGLLLALPAAGARGAAGEPPLEGLPGAVSGGRDDPCRGGTGGQAQRLDRLRRGVEAGVCSSSRWFDGLFGDARDYAESYDQTFGRVGAGLAWDELDQFSFDGHFRANVSLPALGERFNAVIGRETEESYLDDNFDGVGFLPGSFSDDQSADWYAGINYKAVDGTNSRFDLGAGLQVKSPLNPYVKARYRYYIRAAEQVLLTSRSTAFWENRDGFGVTLALDTDWSLGQGYLLRWANTLTRSQATDGVRWKSRLAFYQALSQLSALRYEAAIRGESEGIQPDLREFKLTYRRSMWRDWFFLEAYGGVFWADSERPARICDACGMAGIGFEMMFGGRYDSAAADAGEAGG